MPIRTKTPSTTLAATDPRAMARPYVRSTGYRPMAIPAQVAAQTSSISAVPTTSVSRSASAVRWSVSSRAEPNGSTLRMLAAEHAMSRTPTAIAFPR